MKKIIVRYIEIHEIEVDNKLTNEEIHNNYMLGLYNDEDDRNIIVNSSIEVNPTLNKVGL